MMKVLSRIFAFVLTFAIVLLAFPINAMGVSVSNAKESELENQKIIFPKLKKTPVADGKVSFGEYGASQVHSFKLGQDNPGFKISDCYELTDDPNLAIDFYAGWDENNLYMAWKVNTKYDSRIPKGIGDGYMYEYCCVQFMLTTGAPNKNEIKYQTGQWNGDYLEVGLCLKDDGLSYKVCWSQPSSANGGMTQSDWEFKGSREGTITTYEVRIPFAKLGMNDIHTGTQFGLTYAVGAQEQFNNVAMGMVEYQDALLYGKHADSAAIVTLTENDKDAVYLEKIAAKVGDKNESSAFDAVVNSITKKDGKTVSVTLSIENITEKLTGVIFTLCYDAERLTLTTKKNPDGTLNFVRDGFGNRWENLSTVNEVTGQINFQMIVADDLTQVLNAGGTYTATFTFELKDGYDDAGLWVPNNSVRGMMTSFRSCVGNGSYSIAERIEAPILLNIELVGNGSVEVNDRRVNSVNGTAEEIIEISSNENLVVINIVPADGYLISSILLDGKEYSIRDVLELEITEDTTITIRFELNGDPNGDGKLDAFDYQLLKAFVTGAFTSATEKQKLCMDVNHDGRIDAFDYQMLKAHVLGTYVIR